MGTGQVIAIKKPGYLFSQAFYVLLRPFITYKLSLPGVRLVHYLLLIAKYFFSFFKVMYTIELKSVAAIPIIPFNGNQYIAIKHDAIDIMLANEVV